MKKPTFLIALIFFFVVACSKAEPDPTETQLPPTDALVPTVTSTSLPVPTPTESPTTPTPTPEPLSPPEIFDLVSPSIAYVQLPNQSGSGVLIEDGYIVTNAHVVWPYNEARIVFPDGSEYLEVPVRNLDLMADLALLGPIEVNAVPQELVSGEELIIGSDVYLIGYPGEPDEFPQPTITRGLISRVREWEFLEITYFQTDATIAGGQSGGVLVSDRGDVIGISGISFTEAGFGIVASAGDIKSRIEGLVEGNDVDQLGDRRIPQEEGNTSQTVILSNPLETQVFILNEPVGTKVSIEFFGVRSGGFTLIDPNGLPVLEATNSDSLESVEESAEIETEGPHFLIVFQMDTNYATFSITSSHNLTQYDNFEEGRRNIITSPYESGSDAIEQGSIDYPGDTDTYEITLKKGEEVTIRVDSILIDPFVGIVFPGAGFDEFVSDDDSGGGIFGLSSELTYRAPHDSVYLIFVEDATSWGKGGYVLTVEEPYEGAPTPVAISPTAVPVESPFGPMALYESNDYPFTMRYPADWNRFYTTSFEAIKAQCAFLECFHSPDGNTLQFLELDLETINGRDLSLDDFIELLKANAETQGNTFISQQSFVTEQGLNGIIIEYRNAFLDGAIVIEFAFINEGVLFDASYIVAEEDAAGLEEMIMYSFGTFEVINE